MDYCVVKDKQGQSYVIPAYRRLEWYSWSYGEAGDPPAWAAPTEGNYVVFSCWRIEDSNKCECSVVR